jgi:spore coat polysaccharide biosynthesis protein SpsF
MAEQRVVALIQARMSSTRLPGKTLLELGGRSVLANVVARVQAASLIDRVVVATTTDDVDDAIVAEASRLGVPAFRGSREDVLDRFLGAATAYDAAIVVRVTSDCPLLDPDVIDRVVQALLDSGADYASNTIQRSYPRGLDVEAFRVDTLRLAATEATMPEDREHVTTFVHRHPERFRRASVVGSHDHSHHRWTLDTHEDLEFLREVFAYARITPDRTPGFGELLDTVDAHPEIASINAGVRQKSTSVDH